MNSPDEIPFNSFIELDRNSETAIYLQLSNQFAKAIQLGFLPAGTKLPGTRKLSLIFQLHRNTIVASLHELEAQGWIEIIPNKGSFILNSANKSFENSSNKKYSSLNLYPTKSGFEFEKSILLDHPYEEFSERLFLTDGTVDHRLTELKIPAKLYSSVLKRSSSIQKIKQNNNDYFLKNFANYLNITRGLRIEKENILITRSFEISLSITSKIILKKDDFVAVTELSYYKSNMIFQSNQAKIIQIKQDEFGINIDHLRSICNEKQIKILYLSPHQHYPTTVSLQSERKIELLQLANEFGFVIIEDDYDFDFHYNHQPKLPLASTDQHGMVIYTGKFGQYLAPGYRIGFVVAPKDFIEEAKKHLAILDQQVDPIIEQVLGEMIDEGDITRTLKKIRKTYKERRDYFCHHLYESLHDKIDFTLPKGGLAIWIKFKQPINLMQLKKDCAIDGLFIPQTVLYQTKNITAMRVGFAHLNFEEIEEIISILKKNINN